MTISFRRPGYACTDHFLDVPLDHADPGGPTIRLYAREVVAPGRQDDDLPWLLYLQGGPGNKAPRPGASPAAWLGRALRDYRVLLLDQRGTGRSTPANRQTLPAAPADAAAYLRHFRADSIVRDAELLRRHLIGDRPWSVLGQSFGGFCTVTYLSLAPEGSARRSSPAGCRASPRARTSGTAPRTCASSPRTTATSRAIPATATSPPASPATSPNATNGSPPASASRPAGSRRSASASAPPAGSTTCTTCWRRRSSRAGRARRCRTRSSSPPARRCRTPRSRCTR
ncbi:alpha/beta fold hydrolase [Actinomadura yumaensis]|uniref:alpha/beta fold hydrolase n=1 Tax=Actinomadura yumaensis TaxID=111807 RepID=UPI003614A152